MIKYYDVLIFFAGFFVGYFLRPRIEPIIKTLAVYVSKR